MGITVRKYEQEDGEKWDAFVRGAKNATFLFERGFMDYHADRFVDHSLIAENDGRVIALLPANLSGHVLHSHQGLTYGGWLTDREMTAPLLLAVFEAALALLAERRVTEIVYKCMPRIYHQLPADEDLYALFRLHGVLFRRDLATVVELAARPGYSSQRKRNIAKGAKANLTVVQTADAGPFHALLTQILQARHGTAPVHSAAELNLLMGRFPSNIKLFLCIDQAEICAATLVFETEAVAHTQYLTSSERGRACGALDYLLDYLLTTVYADKKYLSFGISTEEGGRHLNEGLVGQKEGFGGRSIAHDFYKVPCTAAGANAA